MGNDLTEEEIILLITKLQNGEGGDEQASAWIDQLEKAGLYEISDLIFHGNCNLTPQEILSKARVKSKPIQL